MLRSTYFSRRFCHCFAAWPAPYVVGVVVLALGGCGLDRTGLEHVLLPGVGGNPGNGDAAADRIVVGSGGSGGSIVGTGGESGAGGGIVVDGTGGKIDGGGMNGAGGMIAGSGGIIGTGGTIVGTGGMAGSGGMIAGSGGMIGTGGTIAGTGGSADGGTGGAVGDAGTGGTGLGGSPGMGGMGMGGMGVAGAPGVGGAGAPVCPTPCGPCQRCGASHSCEVDPASTWDVSAIAASINPVDPNVKASNATKDWDVDTGGEIGGSQPDPFVELDYLSTAVMPIGHTTPITDTLLPNWGALMGPAAALLNPMNAPVHASDLMAGGKSWLITVFDDDVDTAVGPFGEIICDINGPLTSADFINGGFTRVNVDSCFSVSIKLTCHP